MELILRSMNVPELGTVAQTSHRWSAVLATDRPWAAYLRPTECGTLVAIPHPQLPRCPLRVQITLMHGITDQSARARYPQPVRVFLGDMHTRLVRNLDMLRRETSANWRTLQYSAEFESDEHKCLGTWTCLWRRLKWRRTALECARLVQNLTASLGLHLKWLTQTGRHVEVAERRSASPNKRKVIQSTVGRLSRRFAFLSKNLEEVLRVFRW